MFQVFTKKCRSAGAVRNDVVVQLLNAEQPLGGLGSSGYGRYFGKYSFDAFTHKFPVTYRPLGSVWDYGNLRCHPYLGLKAKLLEDYIMYLPKVTSRKLLLLGILVPLALLLNKATAMPVKTSTFKLWLAFKLETVVEMLRASSE